MWMTFVLSSWSYASGQSESKHNDYLYNNGVNNLLTENPCGKKPSFLSVHVVLWLIVSYKASRTSLRKKKKESGEVNAAMQAFSARWDLNSVGKTKKKKNNQRELPSFPLMGKIQSLSGEIKLLMSLNITKSHQWSRLEISGYEVINGSRYTACVNLLTLILWPSCC